MTVARLIHDNSPESRLGDLKAQRTELLVRVADLTAARQQLDAATDGERAAVAALAELDAVEIFAASEWASTGASGTPLAPDNHKRRELAERLASAQAAAAAARGAGANVEGELAGLRAELAVLAADIEAVALEVMESERIAAMKELESVAAHAGKLLARVRGHVQCIGQRGRDLRDSGDPGRARQYFILGEALAGKPLPDPAPTVGDLDAARLQWQQRFGELKA